MNKERFQAQYDIDSLETSYVDLFLTYFNIFYLT